MGKQDNELQVVYFRVPSDLWRKVKAQAALSGKTVSELLVEKLEDWLEKQKEV